MIISISQDVLTRLEKSDTSKPSILTGVYWLDNKGLVSYPRILNLIYIYVCNNFGTMRT